MSAMQSAAGAALRQRAASVPRSEETRAAATRHDEPLPPCFAVLGLTRACDEREVTRAYRMLAAKWHPDKWQTAPEKQQQLATEKFRALQNAFAEAKELFVNSGTVI